MKIFENILDWFEDLFEKLCDYPLTCCVGPCVLFIITFFVAIFAIIKMVVEK